MIFRDFISNNTEMHDIKRRAVGGYVFIHVGFQCCGLISTQNMVTILYFSGLERGTDVCQRSAARGNIG